MLLFVTDKLAGAAVCVTIIVWLPRPATETVTTAVRVIAIGFASAVIVKELFRLPEVGLTFSQG